MLSRRWLCHLKWGGENRRTRWWSNNRVFVLDTSLIFTLKGKSNSRLLMTLEWPKWRNQSPSVFYSFLPGCLQLYPIFSWLKSQMLAGWNRKTNRSPAASPAIYLKSRQTTSAYNVAYWRREEKTKRKKRINGMSNVNKSRPFSAQRISKEGRKFFSPGFFLPFSFYFNLSHMWLLSTRFPTHTPGREAFPSTPSREWDDWSKIIWRLQLCSAYPACTVPAADRLVAHHRLPPAI